MRLIDADALIGELHNTYLYDDNARKVIYRKIEEQPTIEPQLDEWCDDCKEYNHETHSCPRWNHVIRETLDDVRKEATAQRWIPVTERLPEEREWLGTKKFGTTISDEVYVTFENPKGERFCKHLSFQNGKLSAYDKSMIDAFYKGSKPIAWMPLPEPYKGEQV